LKLFRFVDLFAGIGGIRIAFENAGGRCILTSEINDTALVTYKANDKPGRGHRYAGDITAILDQDIPKYDVLGAGFPCQPYSMAGLRRGLEDPRGHLFMDVLRFIKIGNPKAFLLENVKGLVGHDEGQTFKFMLDSLQEQGEYDLHWRVLNSMTHANIPQNRERVFIVGIRKDQKNSSGFLFPKEIPLGKQIKDILQPDSEVPERFFYDGRFKSYSDIRAGVTETNVVYQWRRQYVRANKSGVCPTLTANMGGGGHNVPLVMTESGAIRKLTPRECARIQGFPDEFKLPELADSHLYHQFGNSVTVPLIERIAKSMAAHLR
jgi:DNA (cytosine-5)-methyltransferase 1